MSHSIPDSRKLTIGERLDNEWRRYEKAGWFFTPMSLADLHLRALYRKRKMWKQMKAMNGLDRRSWEHGVESDYLSDLTDAYRNDVTTLWLRRQASRYGRAA